MTEPVVIVIAGELDVDAARALVPQLNEAGGGDCPHLILDLSAVTLKDIYDALGSPRLLAMGVHLENPSCLVEQAVNRSLAWQP